MRPTSIKVNYTEVLVRMIQLLLGNPITLSTNSEQLWSYTWDNLPKFSNNGIEYKYTVKEVEVPNGYTASYSDDD